MVVDTWSLDDPPCTEADFVSLRTSVHLVISPGYVSPVSLAQPFQILQNSHRSINFKRLATVQR